EGRSEHDGDQAYARSSGGADRVSHRGREWIPDRGTRSGSRYRSTSGAETAGSRSRRSRNASRVSWDGRDGDPAVSGSDFRQKRKDEGLREPLTGAFPSRNSERSRPKVPPSGLPPTLVEHLRPGGCVYIHSSC